MAERVCEREYVANVADAFAGVESVYNHGNQPGLHMAWLFNYSGRPWLTQHWVRQICDTFYGTDPVHGYGYGQDEDQGQLGAWFVLAEPERLTLAGLDGGRVRSLRSTLMQGEPLAALEDLLTREALLAGEAAPAPLWIESVLPPLNWQGVGGGRSVHPLASGREALAAMLDD